MYCSFSIKLVCQTLLVPCLTRRSPRLVSANLNVRIILSCKAFCSLRCFRHFKFFIVTSQTNRGTTPPQPRLPLLKTFSPCPGNRPRTVTSRREASTKTDSHTLICGTRKYKVRPRLEAVPVRSVFCFIDFFYFPR